jgi:transposase
VKKLKCICGIDTIAAVRLAAEVGDFNRFKAAKDFASYTGLCPGRHSSGLSDRGTGITKQGNGYLVSVKRIPPEREKNNAVNLP